MQLFRFPYVSNGKPLGSQVKWMMYWIVFALFTTAETITDVFLAFWYVGLILVDPLIRPDLPQSIAPLGSRFITKSKLSSSCGFCHQPHRAPVSCTGNSFIRS
jgi:hypothetical protein